MVEPVKKEIGNAKWAKYYREYQSRLATEYLIPTLSGWGVRVSGGRLLEVGCGDGGCGAAFYESGCSVVMTDIEERLVVTAREANAEEGIEAKVFVGDVFDEGNPAYAEGPYDIVMFRDVMEHLEDPRRALRTVANYLTDGGVVFVVFPPYYSPYGAHQQILPRRKIGPVPYNKLPYIQLLPDPWFDAIVRGDTTANEEVRRLRKIRLTIRKFGKAVEEAGLDVRARRMYLTRPSFALRYGIKTMRASIIGEVPVLNELLVTAAYYLLEPKRGSTK